MLVQSLKTFLFLFLFTLSATFVLAQGTTGAIVGDVTDSESQPIGGVTVTLTSPALIEGTLTAETTGDGYYRFTNLPPGDYKIEFGIAGFSTLVREGIRVQVGATLTINAALQLAPVEETILLTGETPLVATKEATISTNFNQEQLENIPSARDVWALMEITPGVITDKFSVGGIESGLQSLFSARGGSWTQNQFSLNGINVTDPSAIGASDFYFDFDTFEEVQVSTGAHSAEVDVPGVYINVVTKSGGNEWHGGAKFLYENDALQGSNLNDALADQFNLPADQRDKFQTLDYLSDVAFQIGGPLLKDKLWVFGSYRDHRIHRFVPFYPVAEGTDIKYVLTKGTYQLNQDNKVSGLWARNYYLKPDRGAVDFGGGNVTTESTWIEDDVSDVYQATYTSVLSQNTFVDARVSYVDLYFPLKLKNTNESHLDLGTGLFSESAYNGYILERRRLQINGSLSYYKDNFLGGKHDFKVGVDVQGSFVDNTVQSNNDLTYFDFNGAPLIVLQKNTPVFTKNRVNMYSFFAQDAYSLDNLTLNLGLRWDITRAYNPEQTSPGGRFSDPRTVPKSRNILDWSDIAPRLNAIYDVSGDGTFAIKGNYSRYFHQVPVAWPDFENFAGYGGQGFLWNDPNGDGVFQEGEEGALIFRFGGPFGPGEEGVNFVDENFKRPITDEFTLGMDKELANNWLVSLDLIYRKEKNLQEDVNVGVPFDTYIPVTITDPGPDGVPGTGDDGGQITVFNQNPATFGQDIFVYTNPDGLESDYKGVEIQVTKRLSNRWQMLTGLTFGRANGFVKGIGAFGISGADNGFDGALFDNPNSLINAEGRQFWDRPVIFKFAGSYQAPYDVILAGFFRAQSGQPFGRVIVVGGLNQGTANVFAEPIGTIRLDNVYTLDLRAEKRFNLGRGALGVSLDIFNVFNSNTTLEADNLSGPTFLRPRTILAPRVARLGIRYDF